MGYHYINVLGIEFPIAQSGKYKGRWDYSKFAQQCAKDGTLDWSISEADKLSYDERRVIAKFLICEYSADLYFYADNPEFAHVLGKVANLTKMKIPAKFGHGLSREVSRNFLYTGQCCDFEIDPYDIGVLVRTLNEIADWNDVPREMPQYCAKIRASRKSPFSISHTFPAEVVNPRASYMLYYLNKLPYCGHIVQQFVKKLRNMREFLAIFISATYGAALYIDDDRIAHFGKSGIDNVRLSPPSVLVGRITELEKSGIPLFAEVHAGSSVVIIDISIWRHMLIADLVKFIAGRYENPDDLLIHGKYDYMFSKKIKEDIIKAKSKPFMSSKFLSFLHLTPPPAFSPFADALRNVQRG